MRVERCISPPRTNSPSDRATHTDPTGALSELHANAAERVRSKMRGKQWTGVIDRGTHRDEPSSTVTAGSLLTTLRARTQ